MKVGVKNEFPFEPGLYGPIQSSFKKRNEQNLLHSIRFVLTRKLNFIRVRIMSIQHAYCSKQY